MIRSIIWIFKQLLGWQLIKLNRFIKDQTAFLISGGENEK